VHGADLAVFKKVVTGQEIYTDVKGRAGFKFRPYCTTMFSANTFPRLGSDDEGVMRRLFPIRFNAVFSPSDPDYDPDIGEKLAAEECMEAAIVRGVAGLRRVVENRRPTPNAESAAMVDQIREDNSSLLQWMRDEDVKREDMVGWQTSAAYESYSRWCESSGIRNRFGKPAFGREVVEKLDLRTSVVKRDGKNVRVYQEPER
jgi:putative DNA primase/helicase